MPDRQVREQWEYPRKMNDSYHFSIPFPNSLFMSEEKYDNGPVCKMERFGRIGPTGQGGPTPEVDPNIRVEMNRKGPFHLTSD